MLRVIWPAAHQRSSGFAAYYTGSWLVRQGVDVERFYDDDWFAQQVRQVPGLESIPDIWFINPPVMALPFLPLTMFDAAHARVIWTVISVLMLAAAIALLIRILHLPWFTAAGLVLITLLFQPVRANF